MILVLARGMYCPKDQQQHKQLVAFYPELVVGLTTLVTISTDNLSVTKDFRTGLGAQWTFLSDPDRKVQKDLDIQEYTDPHHDPMIPHTLVLAPALKIFRIYNGYWHWGRPSVNDLRADLKELTRSIRPDWSLLDQKLKAAWRDGRKDLFYPYA